MPEPPDSNPAPIEVAVLGAQGQMGRFACEWIRQAVGFHVCAELGSGDALERGALGGARVALDVTQAGLGFDHGLALLDLGVRIVIGTSGVDEAQTERLDGCARELGLGGCVVPNFSIGAWLQQRLAAEAARYLGSVNIVEMHHLQKRDAPSGTAVQTAETLTRVTGEPVPIQSVRLAGLHARQDVLLGGPGEILSLSHQVAGREAYGPGLIHSLRYAAEVTGVTRGLDDVLAWRAQ